MLSGLNLAFKIEVIEDFNHYSRSLLSNPQENNFSYETSFSPMRLALAFSFISRFIFLKLSVYNLHLGATITSPVIEQNQYFQREQLILSCDEASMIAWSSFPELCSVSLLFS